MLEKKIYLISVIIFLPLFGFASYLYIEQRSLSKPFAVEIKNDSIEVKNILNNQENVATSSKIVSNSSLLLKQVIPKDWATVSSAQGFSFHYPYKEIGAMWGDDGVFQVVIFFPPALVTTDEGATEGLLDDISSLQLNGLTVSVIEDSTVKNDLKSWIITYLGKNKLKYVVLSENINSINFAGLQGYEVIRSVEGPKNQGAPQYTQKEIFVSKNNFVYQVTTVLPSANTSFLRVGSLGKKYLQRVSVLSQEVLKTFMFNSSKVASISFPKISAPQLVGEKKDLREKLLSILHEGVSFDKNTSYPPLDDACTENGKNPSKESLVLWPGMYANVDVEIADIHGYDQDGGHTGLLPEIPGIGYGQFPEEGVREISFDKFGSQEMLAIQKNIDGRIEVVGRGYGWVNFSIRGEGNSCGIVRIEIPVTPYSVATLLITKEGDWGPFSYDIDGDGKQDFMLSLKHPLLQEKKNQINTVIENIKSMK